VFYATLSGMLQAFMIPSPRMLGWHGAGLGAANANVKAMQQALAAYATATNYPLANPGAIDGFIGPRTRDAVLAVLPRLPKLPSAVKSLLQYGAMVAVIPEVAKHLDDLIVSYASEITTALKLLQVVQTPATPGTPTGAGTTATPVVPATPAPGASLPAVPTPAAGLPATGALPAPAWYKTGPGMAALGVGATAVMASAILLATR
jgi:hypothetical protein